MKNRKPAARQMLAVTAGCAALALSACSAGQISQTADQVPAVNGNSGEIGDAAVHDVTLVTQEDNSVALKFNASNQAIQEGDITLEGIDVQGGSVNFGSSLTLQPNCNVVADSQQALDEMNPGDVDLPCTEYVATTVTGDNFYTGSAREVTFRFSSGSLEINAPIAAWYAEAGTTYRHQDGVTRDHEETDGHSENINIG